MRRLSFLPILCLLGGPLVAGCCHCKRKPGLFLQGPPQKFAVLVSTEMTDNTDESVLEPGLRYNNEWWNDLVLTYCTLTENGFRARNIFVLYGEGEDFKSDLPDYRPPYCDGSRKITDIRVTDSQGPSKANLCNVLCCLGTGYPAAESGSACQCSAQRDKGLGGFTCRGFGIPRLREEDFLLLWLKGDGNQGTGCNIETMLRAGYTLTGTEMREMVNELAPRRKVLVLDTCDSGGWVGFLKREGTAVLVSSGNPEVIPDCHEESGNIKYCEDPGVAGATVWPATDHGRFAYWINSTLRQPGLTVPNRLVSVQQAYDAAVTALRVENAAWSQILSTTGAPPPLGSWCQGAADIGRVPPEQRLQTPAIGDQEHISACVFIRIPHPGGAEILAMDHADDDANVPTNDVTEPWDGGQGDLVVQETPPSGEPNQLPIPRQRIDGRTNFSLVSGRDYEACVTVRNVGCDDPGPVTATFQWTDASTSADAASMAGTAEWTSPEASGPQRGQSKSFCVDLAQLMGQTPSPGKYRLIATLHSPRDQPNSDSRAYWDNNKVQVNVAISP